MVCAGIVSAMVFGVQGSEAINQLLRAGVKVGGDWVIFRIALNVEDDVRSLQVVRLEVETEEVSGQTLLPCY